MQKKGKSSLTLRTKDDFKILRGIQYKMTLEKCFENIPDKLIALGIS